MKEFEDSGFEAGIAGKPLEESRLWSQAWDSRGTNLPAHVIAGWVAGRAIWRLKQEGYPERPQKPVGGVERPSAIPLPDMPP